MKIVVMPGVGFQTAHNKYEKFSNRIASKLECQSEVFYWEHKWEIPDIKLSFSNIRKWIYEVILDFQQVVLYAFDMKLPEADYYIGHSAGSILALTKHNVPSIIFGSPAMLVEAIHATTKQSEFNIDFSKAIKSKKNILNIINQYDLLSYYLDLPNVENYVFKGAWYNPNTYNPIVAHNCYWNNGHVMDIIVKTINKWEQQKIS